MADKITIAVVLAEVNRPNSIFSLTYRKKNGEWGEKHRVAARTSTNKLDARKKMNRSGLLKLYNLDTKEEFDLTIDLLETFNGSQINFYGQ